MTDPRIDRQQGSATILAVVAMIFLTIVIAGLLPMITQELRSAGSDRDVLETRYVAEAGVKRALVHLQRDSDQWDWIEQNGVANWRPFAGDGTGTKAYTVRLVPNIELTQPKPKKKTTYQIYSTGKVGTITYTAFDTFTTPQGSSDWGGGDINPNPPNPPPPLSNEIIDTMQTSGYVSYNIGSSLTINNNVTITGGTLGTSATDITNQSSAPIQTGINLTVPPIPISLAPTTYSSSTPLSGAPPSGTTALAGTYYVSGGLNTNSNSILSATGGTSGDVTIFANGPINIGDDVVTNASTNLTLASSSSININSNVDLVGNIQLYAKEDLIINSNSDLTGADLQLTGYGLFMAGRDIYINSNVNLNKAVLIAGRDLYINANSTVVGQIIAGRNIILNSNCTIIMADVL
ncbi:MAG: hypothetical protein RIN56_04300 [Sporomusaceae bacterium]|nr:hypothetical protein [Sporomusaceae bacterium]